ncbi:DUF397 domain-containing protein [Alloactinosynnema sp. L-07]|uniref:DUF397 domain-containing protein n=1 Tax=Alloactinosynnema sp. L-07 TaxID=1653480 RepID=UPI0009EF5E3C|nr:DUF397 domain-containing protein [Alloactinosynnema sp. L-07]
MELGQARWRKSTFSGGEDCVELARFPDMIAVRDSKHPAGGILTFPALPSQLILFHRPQPDLPRP